MQIMIPWFLPFLYISFLFLFLFLIVHANIWSTVLNRSDSSVVLDFRGKGFHFFPIYYDGRKAYSMIPATENSKLDKTVIIIGED